MIDKIKNYIKNLKKYFPKVINKYIGNDSTSLYNEDAFWSHEKKKGIVNKMKIPFYKKVAHFSLNPCPSIGIKIIKPNYHLASHLT